MSVFVGTSALFAILDADDQNHEQAKQVWVSLVTQGRANLHQLHPCRGLCFGTAQIGDGGGQGLARGYGPYATGRVGG